MTFKTILTVVGIDHKNADLVSVAEIADGKAAHLTAVILGCVPPPPFGDITGEAYTAWSQIWEAENKRLDDRTAELKQLLADKSLKVDIQPIYCIRGDVAEHIGERARYADLTVLSGDMLTDDLLYSRVLDGALFQSPIPAVLTPKLSETALAPKRVLVAWNAGVEVGRAVRQSMDMLVAAEDVHIVVVDPQATSYAMGQEPGADIAAFLARHGVKTTVDVLPSGGGEIDAALRKHAVDINADLIVMGAYGHSRMRERIFGGTTHSMIENLERPLLLAR